MMVKIMGRGVTSGRLLAALLLALLVTPATAGWKTPREALDQRLLAGPFHVYYAREGTPERDDAVLEEKPGRMVAQLRQADVLYSGLLGLTPPLKSERYRGAGSIDIHLIPLEGKNGSTGDELQHFDYRAFGAAGPVLTIAIDSGWQPPNLTPNHELFHAYQYAYTFFKNRWYLEGMARSMENLFRDRGWRNERLPRDREELEVLLGRSYKAERFWNRLALLCDPGCERSPEASFTPVGEPTRRRCGVAIVKPLLEQFQHYDKVAARDRGLDPAHWPEEEQRAEGNDPYLLRGVMRTLESTCPLGSSDELGAFHRLLEEVTDAAGVRP